MAPELERSLERRGGVFLPPPHYQKLFEEMRIGLTRLTRGMTSSFWTDKDRPVYLAITSRQDISAFACSSPDEDLIGITASTIIIIENYLRIVARSQQLNSPYNAGEPLTKAECFDSIESLRRSLLWPAPEPAEGNRRDFWERARNSAISWLFLHELGHISDGHTDLARIELGLDDIEDREDLERHVSLVRQTLEYDADAFASKHIYEGCLGIKPGTGVTAEEGHFLHWVYDATFGIYTLFLLFGGSRSFIGDPSDFEGSHPPPSIRQAWCVNFPGSLLAIRDPGFDLRRLDRALGAAIYDAEDIFSRLTGSQTRNPFEPEQVEAQSRFIQIYAEEWKVLRAKLEPFTRGGTLAPAVNPIA